MTLRSAAAADAARRLWARVAGDTSAPDEVAAAAERMCAQLRAGLGRWIGADGYRTLLARSLLVARAEHPELGGISCLGEEEPAIAAAVRTHGAAEVGAGMMAIVTVLIELLGRIIGEEMAMRLVEQTCMLTPRGVEITSTGGGRDG